jgi:hypothetical protein
VKELSAKAWCFVMFDSNVVCCDDNYFLVLSAVVPCCILCRPYYSSTMFDCL